MYILVTSWPRHWDKIGGKSSYTYSMLRGSIMNPDKIVDQTPAIFIKVDKETRLPQKCWEGKMLGKKRTEEKIWFEFRLDRVVECAQIYGGSRDGWHVDET